MDATELLGREVVVYLTPEDIQLVDVLASRIQAQVGNMMGVTFN